MIRLPGTTSFVPLEQLRQVPVGSEIDATKGAVSLESATGIGKTTQSLVAYSGRFVVTQPPKKLAVTTLRLSGGDFAVCTRKLAIRVTGRPARVARRLWGKGKGRFATRGRYSSSTVRGTFWLTEDRCDGTRTTVRQGIVAVNDFPRRRKVLVRAGHSYLARAS